ncbi:glycosyltransferase family 2 protein [Nonomuraea basaltis]|uniref:glycosyltransferase family 2 protein n=1 Tax=Nonomuraea basaltis TaxID=2495887 RepID=UPI00110C5C17|nr:glycosyltransferase family 2 protein [Nonomuraea basaltis]TMR92144.1 glycosyltransferase family 2 protein [Nonomuraea basaltis]
MSVTPCGFVRTPEKGLARLHWADTGWAVDGEPPDVPALRSLRGLEIEWPDAEVPLDGLLRLAAAGIPLTAGRAAPWVPADLAALLIDRAWLDHAADGTARSLADLRREEHSVRLRRLAHPTPTPKVSIVMSSKRPALVGAALAQMERQRGVEAEVLLGLHGVAFEQVRAVVERCALPVTWVEAAASVPFGEVLNRAAALASGDYLAKWDDDDWYGPRHLSDLFMALTYAGADVVGTTAEFFYLEPLKATIRRTTFASGARYPSEVWSDHVAGGTIMVPLVKFREIGGFPGLSRAVDLEFLKVAHQSGARIYRTHGLGYVLRRGLSDEHTWQLPLAHFLKVAANQWRGFRPSLLMEAA